MNQPAKVTTVRAGMGRRDWMLAALGSMVAGTAALRSGATPKAGQAKAGDLWSVWDTYFARAKFVYLSHVLTPDSPLWYGFHNPQHLPSFKPALITDDKGKTFHEESWDKDGHGS